MGLLDDADLPPITRDDLVSMTNAVDEKIHFLSNPFGQKLKIVQEKRLDLRAGQIYIGIDKMEQFPVIIFDNEITTHYCFLGATGSGKTCLAEDFISKLYYQHNNIFTIILDIKGEWYQSLLYKYGGVQFSHLKDRLYKLDSYKKGMIRKLACEDTIIVFDLSSINIINNLLLVYSQVRDMISDIADWIISPKGHIQLNALFEESALWFPNDRSEFKDLFDVFDAGVLWTVGRAGGRHLCGDWAAVSGVGLVV